VRTNSIFVTVIAIVAALVLSGCKPDNSAQQGIAMSAVTCQGDSSALPAHQCLPGTVSSPIPYIPVSGVKLNDDYDAQGNDLTQGSVSSFGFSVYGDSLVDTGKSGTTVIPNAEAPAYWNAFWLIPYNCGNTNDLTPANWTM